METSMMTISQRRSVSAWYLKRSITAVLLMAALFSQWPFLVSAQNSNSQQPSGSKPKPRFEVATVKLSAPDARGKGGNFLIPFSSMQPQSGLFSANVPLATYVLFAYDIQDPVEKQPQILRLRPPRRTSLRMTAGDDPRFYLGSGWQRVTVRAC
jgi:hypothetical protein